MKIDDDNIDILQNLEFSVVQIWRAHPEMTDYTALRAYDAAFQIYRAELRGHIPKPPGLSGLDAEVFEAVKEMCEFRLDGSRGWFRIRKAWLPLRWNCSWIVCAHSSNRSNATPKWTGERVI
jgi:hypothetical protein